MYRDFKQQRPKRPLTGTGPKTIKTYFLTGEMGDFERLIRPHGEILAVRWSGSVWAQWTAADRTPIRRGRRSQRPAIRPPVKPRAWVTIRATPEGWIAIYNRFRLDPTPPPVKPRMRGPGVLWRCTHADDLDPVVCRALDADAAKVEACRVWGLNPAEETSRRSAGGVYVTQPERDLITCTRIEEQHDTP